MRLDEIAKVIRSKNAGPQKITFDIMFDNNENYQYVRSKIDIFRAEVAKKLGVEGDKISLIDYAPAKAIKVVMTRAITAGDPGDRDAYGAQQASPLLGIEL